MRNFTVPYMRDGQTQLEDCTVYFCSMLTATQRFRTGQIAHKLVSQGLPLWGPSRRNIGPPTRIQARS